MFGIASRKSTFVFPDEEKSCPPAIERRRLRRARWIVVLRELDVTFIQRDLVFENLCKIVELGNSFPPRLPRIIWLAVIRDQRAKKLGHLASKVLNFSQGAPLLVRISTKISPRHMKVCVGKKPA